ncbi:MAG: hypothetical protein JO263_03115 [Candidatus Eremiobacteraeota bacterium]|nr:hypothetical protein [Candidatus Eremiobacteraeota bacterium]
MRIRSTILAFALGALTTALAGAAMPLKGTFALQGSAAKTAGYLDASRSGAEPNAWRLDFWMSPQTGATPIRAYDLDMTKLLHVIIVSDDFTRFIHTHPQPLANGHFILDQTLPGPGLYHVYSDGRPSGIGQQVFRFDLQNGSAAPSPKDLSERSKVAHVDGYAVALSTLSLRVGSMAPIAVHVTKNGRAAADIHPYLGALAHAVFLDAGDLSYVHVHPVALGSTMMMEAASAMVYSNDKAVVSPNMLLHVTVNEPGTYKLWFQFRGGASLHVASFVINAGR